MLVSEMGLFQGAIADAVERLGSDASEGYKLACRDIAGLLRAGWPHFGVQSNKVPVASTPAPDAQEKGKDVLA